MTRPSHRPSDPTSSRRLRAAARLAILAGCTLLGACAGPAPAPVEAPPASTQPVDPEHAGITDPHGDHSPHHGGLVLMNGDVHYEVVLAADGRHALWFSDAVRTELPASIASNVRLTVTRPGAPPESLAMAIDDAGESWVAAGQPLAGPDIMVTVTYDIRGEPHEVEIPYVP